MPRPSLTGDGSGSTTASVLNLTGHKDEYLCRKLAEKICGKMKIVRVCIGGFHLDGLDGIVKERIKEVMEVAEQMSEEILQELEKSFCNTI